MKIENPASNAKETARQKFREALMGNDADAAGVALEQFAEATAAQLKEQYEEELENLRQNNDQKILTDRGVRVLTSEEKQYYDDVLAAMKAENPKQAISNIDKALPTSVVSAVLEEVRSEHRLLDVIDFVPTTAKVSLVYNTNGAEQAAWGLFCDTISKELSGSLAALDVSQFKLSAYLPVCKNALELGAAWLDRYVRETLKEAIASALEIAAADGTGANQPIGMTRDVSPGVSVVDSVYPRKEAIAVTKFDKATFGNLLSLLAMNNGKARSVDGLILVVHPIDYFQKVMPATTQMGPDGEYRRNVLPYPAEIIPSVGVPRNHAILGIAKRYFMGVGTSGKEGKIDVFDQTLALADANLYIVKAFANGRPKDANAFLYLDITNLAPTYFQIEDVTPASPSDDADLAALKIFGVTLAFDPDTTTYTAATTDASNIVYAVPANASATLEVKLGSAAVTNGSAVTWATGSNTLTVKVTAEDGTTNQTYTVTVTKS